MRKWRNSQLIVLALIALLAPILPSLGWACSAADCGGATATHSQVLPAQALPEVGQISSEHCDAPDCASSDCCQPLQLPLHPTGEPAAPPKLQTSASSILCQLLPATDAQTLLAVLPTAPPSIGPSLVEGLAAPDVPPCLLTQREALPLSGRSPPTF